MKKVIALMLCLVLALTTLTGCGGKKGTTDPENTTAPTKAADDTSSNDSGEIVEILWQYPSYTEVTEGFYRMEDALNEMMEKDIGVHVTFIPSDLMTSQQDATLMISSGEQLDVSLTAFTSVSKMVEDGLILPLDDYMDEYGSTVDKNLIGKNYYDGKLYSLPVCFDKQYATSGYNMKKKYADKYGFKADDNIIYTIKEIEDMFAIVKVDEGENFYMITPWNNTLEPLNYSYQEYDLLSGSFSAGVMMLNRSFTDLTVYNYFETPEYKAYCEMMYDWAQKGYIAPDASVDTDYANRVKDDNYLGTFGFCEPENSMNGSSAGLGEDYVQLRTVDGHIKLNGGSNINWNVPITSANPGKAVEAIAYVLNNKAAATLIQYGFEGEEYEVVEDNGEQQVIKYLNDDPTKLQYFNPYGLWGNRNTLPAVYPANIDFGKKRLAYDNSIPNDRYSAALGYSFNSSSVSTEIAAVEAVMAQYCQSFNAGAIDPAKALPEFISALKSAGIDKVIAENQKQLDAWAASK